MRLRLPAPTRAHRPVNLGAVGLLATLVVLLSGCQPRPPAGQGEGPDSQVRTGTNSSGSGKPLTIVALGDSYSSGEGNAPFDLDAPGCGRSGASWPRLLAQEIAGSTARLLACSGAKTSAFTASFHGQPPQVEALRALVASGVKPDIVTITIGGNDAGFGPTIVSCVVWRCFWTGHDDHSREYVTDQLPPLLQAAYSQVKEAAGGARVIVIGYPDLFPSSTANTCRWLDNNERVQLAGLNRDLNRVIRRAASKTGVEFLSIDRVLDAHKLCTKDPWVYPIAVTGAGLQASAHPNTMGQRAIADAVHAYLSRGK
ncbi:MULTISPECIES: SGNH/GDSL hydrolase family protein [unclassified Pseudofrankia]|uniref:SGNH/GDSL hydrolase family protein n=1 Tax=unclassified Pseudofrankia TaxID=2994372 RepID=UPI0008D91F9C|nr:MULTISPECIES: SGNH/GDSL hydrolase family protein [unclassified Pseudofrankia]MDT3443494.1 SGNH/GDSL hydrolase family protein [Pseudofrankia sp. BMG5.37]OHV42705.1 hydrolase [Pseudofrankia sp. BMG5.36]